MNRRQKKKQQQNKHHISYRRMKYLMRYNYEKVVIQRRRNGIPYKNCRRKTLDRLLSKEEALKAKVKELVQDERFRSYVINGEFEADGDSKVEKE